MSKQSELAARAARLSQRPPRTEPDGSRAPGDRPAPRAKPIRVTTDLAPQSYRALVSYCADLAETLGRAKVPHVEVIRALIAQLETDEKLQHTIANTVGTRLSK